MLHDSHIHMMKQKLTLIMNNTPTLIINHHNRRAAPSPPSSTPTRRRAGRGWRPRRTRTCVVALDKYIFIYMCVCVCLDKYILCISYIDIIFVCVLIDSSPCSPFSSLSPPFPKAKNNLPSHSHPPPHPPPSLLFQTQKISQPPPTPPTPASPPSSSTRRRGGRSRPSSPPPAQTQAQRRAAAWRWPFSSVPSPPGRLRRTGGWGDGWMIDGGREGGRGGC